MNEKKRSELKETESELKANEIVTDEELQNNRSNSAKKNFKKSGKPNNPFYFWDLSGGLLGI